MRVELSITEINELISQLEQSDLSDHAKDVIQQIVNSILLQAE